MKQITQQRKKSEAYTVHWTSDSYNGEVRYAVSLDSLAKRQYREMAKAAASTADAIEADRPLRFQAHVWEGKHVQQWPDKEPVAVLTYWWYPPDMVRPLCREGKAYEAHEWSGPPGVEWSQCMRCGIRETAVKAWIDDETGEPTAAPHMYRYDRPHYTIRARSECDGAGRQGRLATSDCDGALAEARDWCHTYVGSVGESVTVRYDVYACHCSAPAGCEGEPEGTMLLIHEGSKRVHPAPPICPGREHEWSSHYTIEGTPDHPDGVPGVVWVDNATITIRQHCCHPTCAAVRLTVDSSDEDGEDTTTVEYLILVPDLFEKKEALYQL